MTPNMTYSQSGLELTESFEASGGPRLTSYWDAHGGCWTIGFGHTGTDVTEGLMWTAEQCQLSLAKDILRAAAVVNQHVLLSLTQHAFEALVDFTFNEGSGNFEKSTLLRLVNSGDMAGADLEFGKWVKSGGVVLSGLIRRRAAETKLFSS
jgi:lysozyme